MNRRKETDGGRRLEGRGMDKRVEGAEGQKRTESRMDGSKERGMDQKD